MSLSKDLPVCDLGIRKVGYAVLFATFGVFGVWAALAPLDSAAYAPGLVTVDGYRKTVQHLEGGIIKELLVRDGDVVKAGSPLIRLDDTQALAEVERVRSQLIAERMAEFRLRAERDGAGVVGFEGDLGDPRVLEAQESESQIFNARRAARLGEESVLTSQIGQLEMQIRGHRVVIEAKREMSASIAEEVADLRALLAEGFVDKQRLREQERRISQLKSEIADLQSSIAQAQQQVGETRLKILQLNKSFASEVASELAERQTRIFDLRERLTAAEDRSRRTLVLAPVDGMVIGLKAHTVGGVAAPGADLLEIVPASGRLVVEVQVSPVDIDRVTVGKRAEVRFSAFNSSTTPVIEGRLTHVSGDRLVNQETGMPYYLGRVELTEQGRKDLADLALVPGMPADALLNTGERTFLSYLVKPASNAFARSLTED